jgi:hypothetical protein
MSMLGSDFSHFADCLQKGPVEEFSLLGSTALVLRLMLEWEITAFQYSSNHLMAMLGGSLVCMDPKAMPTNSSSWKN